MTSNKRLNELVNELPGRVKALPKEGRDSILIAAILDNLEKSKDSLISNKTFSDTEKSVMYKDFVRAQENPEMLFEGNKAVELYAAIRETGNYSINQDIRKYENEVFGKNKDNRTTEECLDHVSRELYLMKNPNGGLK